MTVRAIAAATLRRIVRDRTALFFLIVLPIVVIVVVGSTARGFGEFDVGVVDEDGSELGSLLINDLEAADAIDVTMFRSVDTARTALRRSEVNAVVVVPDGFDADLRAGGTVEVPLIGESANTYTQGARTATRAVIGSFAGRVQAASFVADQVGGSIDDRLVTVDDVASSTAASGVETDVVDAESDYLPEGFSYSAPTMLVLFVFINALAGGANVLEGKRFGVYARALAAPVRTRGLILGEAVAELCVAVGQSLLIVTVGAVVFGVDWGNPLAAGAIIVVWALIGTGAGMLCGTVFRTPEQATSIGPPFGIALGMLGGTMWPLEIVPKVMQTIGRLTPHAWAIDAWIEVLSRGGGVTDIARQLLVLGAFAAALLVVSGRRLAVAIGGGATR